LSSKTDRQVLELWQPVNHLKGKFNWEMYFSNITRHNAYLSISLKELRGNSLEINYDDPNKVCPPEYVVWAFRYTTEISHTEHLNVDWDLSGRKDPDALYFFKMRNSKFIINFYTLL